MRSLIAVLLLGLSVVFQGGYAGTLIGEDRADGGLRNSPPKANQDPVYVDSPPPPPPVDWYYYYGCFPGDARITYADGTVGLMRDLSIGGKVAAVDAEGKVLYSEVYGFGRQDFHAIREFVRLTLTSGSHLELTAGHFIPTGKGASVANKRSSDIRVGDLVWTVTPNNTTSTPATVTGVSVTKNVGLFKPLTMSGSITVNGVVASVHSEWFLDSAFDALCLTEKLPAAYQAILAPARLLYKALGKEVYVGIGDFGAAIAATGAAGLLAGLVLTARAAGSKTKAL